MSAGVVVCCLPTPTYTRQCFFQWFFFSPASSHPNTHLWLHVHCGCYLCLSIKQLLLEGRVECISPQCTIAFRWMKFFLEAHKYSMSHQKKALTFYRSRKGWDLNIKLSLLWHALAAFCQFATYGRKHISTWTKTNSFKPSQRENMRALPLGVQSNLSRETDTHAQLLTLRWHHQLMTQPLDSLLCVFLHVCISSSMCVCFSVHPHMMSHPVRSREHSNTPYI